MDISVRVEVRYLVPSRSRLADVLRLLRSATWVAFMARHIAPRLDKVSPTAASEVDRLTARRHGSCGDCAICMEEGDDGSAVELPCGHGFHADCIRPWLQVQSTCPVCRWQLPKAFAGRYAVRELSSVVMLDGDLAAMPVAQLPAARVGNRYVRTVVTVLLAKVDSLAREKPCVVRAHVADARTGEVFSAEQPIRVPSVAPPQWKAPGLPATSQHCGGTVLPTQSDLMGRRKRPRRAQDASDHGVAAKRRRRHSN